MATGDGGKPSKNAFDAFTKSRATVFPWADSTCFRPEIPAAALVEEEGRVLVNTYQERTVKMTNGDASPFLDHLAKMLPNDRDRLILTSYLAAIIQHKGFKFQWAPLIHGTEGNGKGVILTSMEYAVGKAYTHKPSDKALGESGQHGRGKRRA